MDFGKFYRSHFWFVDFQAKILTNNTMDEEALVNSVTDKVLISFAKGTYSDQNNPLGWLKTVIVNAWKDILRKKVKGMEGKNSVRTFYYDENEDFDNDHNLYLSSEDKEFEFSNDYLAVVEAIDSLGEKQKEVLLDRINHGLSFREISDIQGVSLNTTIGRMRYARKKLLISLSEKLPEGKLYSIVRSNSKMRSFIEKNPEIMDHIKRTKT